MKTTDQKTGPTEDPVKLFWWNERPNFGDAISPLIVEYVAKRPVTWASHTDCQLFSLGSILRRARKGFQHPKDWRPAVWGSGMIGPHRTDFVENVDFFSVRGPATAALLGVSTTSFGDPGLLIADVIGETIERGDTIGVIPHHGQFVNKPVVETLKKLAKLGQVKIIDVRNADGPKVCKEIAACKHVYSESLHGLIVADAYGIPNTWVQGDAIHITPSFKFLDYYLSIGRPYVTPISYDDIFDAVKGLKDVDRISYTDGILAAKASIMKSFPDHLRGSS